MLIGRHKNIICHIPEREKESMAPDRGTLSEGQVLLVLPGQGLRPQAGRKLTLRPLILRTVQMTVTTSQVPSVPSDDDDAYADGGGVASAAGAHGAARFPSGIASTSGGEGASAAGASTAGAAGLASGVASTSGGEAASAARAPEMPLGFVSASRDD